MNDLGGLSSHFWPDPAGSCFDRAMIKRFGVAAAFSVLYAGLFPVLTGGFVIYHHPYWPAPLAAVYVAGGILVQAWFCFGPQRRSRKGLLAQVIAGTLYAAALIAAPGDFYQS
jgi:hypothetical protein